MRVVFELGNRHIDILKRLSEKYGLDEDELVRRSLDALNIINGYIIGERHPFEDFIKEGAEPGLHMILHPGNYLYLNLVKNYVEKLGFIKYPDIEEFDIEYSLSNVFLALTGPTNLKLAWVDVYDNPEASKLEINYLLPNNETGLSWVEKFKSVFSELEEKLMDEFGECYVEYEISKEFDQIFLKIILSCEDIPNLTDFENILEGEVGDIPRIGDK